MCLDEEVSTRNCRNKFFLVFNFSTEPHTFHTFHLLWFKGINFKAFVYVISYIFLLHIYVHLNFRFIQSSQISSAYIPTLQQRWQISGIGAKFLTGRDCAGASDIDTWYDLKNQQLTKLDFTV